MIRMRINTQQFLVLKPCFRWMGLLCLTGTMIAIIWVLLLSSIVNQPRVEVEWMHRLALQKYHDIAYVHRLDVNKDKDMSVGRLIVFGGSSALFGINSEILEKNYHRPTYNLSIAAGLIFPYSLDKNKEYIQPGDIVLMPLEYSLYAWDGIPDKSLIMYLWAYDVNFLYEHKDIMLQLVARTPVSYVLQQSLSPPSMSPYLFYGTDTLNQWGDQTSNTPENQIAAQAQAQHFPKVDPRLWSEINPQAKVWEKLREFNEDVHQRGACLIFLPAPLAWDDSAGLSTDFFDQLPTVMADNNLYFLGKPSGSLYDPSWFFDTEYHLLDQARTQHTESIISLLGPHLIEHCENKQGS